jgi:hypothetical protein
MLPRKQPLCTVCFCLSATFYYYLCPERTFSFLQRPPLFTKPRIHTLKLVALVAAAAAAAAARVFGSQCSYCYCYWLRLKHARKRLLIIPSVAAF